jgi:hypothetical protein
MPYGTRGRRVRAHTNKIKRRRDLYRKVEKDMARKTAAERAAERATERANAELLGEYHAVHSDKLAVDKEDRRLRRAVQAIPDGQWGDYLKTYGDGRKVMDQDAVMARFAELGEEVPMKLTNSMIIRKVIGS